VKGVVQSQRGARLHSRERREGESGVFRVYDFLYIIEMAMGWCRLAGLFFWRRMPYKCPPP
jgi:hypothetical protein